MDQIQQQRGPIALFMHDFASTGVVRNAVRLANALVAHGENVCLLVCSERGRMTQQLDSRVRVEVIHRGWRSRLPRALALLAALPLLRNRVLRLRPRVLVSAGNHAHLPTMLATAGVPGLRRVLRVSNDLDHPGDGRATVFVRNLFQRMLLRGADLLILVSQRIASHPLLAEAVGERRALVIPNGVPVEEVRRLAALGCSHPWIGGAEPLVAAMGRLTRQKNFEILIRAFALASQQRPMKLLIIGAGADAERRRLSAVAESLGVQERLRFEGEMPNPFPLLARCNVFVLPSLWEGASNALLEALACDVPVVAAHTAGNAPEVLGYGYYGLLVDPLDVHGMAQAILLQSGDSPRRAGDRVQSYGMGRSLARACRAIAGQSDAGGLSSLAAMERL